jgi:hypothetical protein
MALGGMIRRLHTHVLNSFLLNDALKVANRLMWSLSEAHLFMTHLNSGLMM